jgi:uncharacterized protein (DUF924 family)
MLTEPEWIADILRFWFKDLTEAQWWTSSPTVDNDIRQRFSGLHERISAFPEDDLLTGPRSALAAVIVLDQMSRNMHRRAAKAFACDAKALRISDQAIARGFDKDLTEAERQFLYMPFMHAEDVAAQERSIKLFASLGPDHGIDSAHDHKAIIDLFGRFPHRNGALGRPSTPDEIAYLSGDAKRFGQ